MMSQYTQKFYLWKELDELKIEYYDEYMRAFGQEGPYCKLRKYKKK